jgi:isopenicillin N synthase-like dioxygenase
MTFSLEAIHVAHSALPIIDIGGLSSDSLTDRRAVAERLRAACLDNGFFYIASHGVPAPLIAALFEETRLFFDSPASTKSAVDKSLSFCARGFEPMRAQTLEAGAPADPRRASTSGLSSRSMTPESWRGVSTTAPISGRPGCPASGP